MIVLNLKCASDHSFEGWFTSSEAFDDQIRSGLVSCPMCANTTIARLPSCPHVKRAVADGSSTGNTQLATDAMKLMAELIAQTENVADRFPEEARKIHYGEAEPRNIRGQASLKDAKELMEEGISVLPLPFPAKKDTH
jgi:hypothetical protein